MCYLSHSLVGCKTPQTHPGATRGADGDKVQEEKDTYPQSLRVWESFASSMMKHDNNLIHDEDDNKPVLPSQIQQKGQVDTTEDMDHLEVSWSKRATSLNEDPDTERL